MQTMRLFVCLLVVQQVGSVPLQWERLLPSGFSPSPRYGASACTLDDLSTSPIFYGGIDFDVAGFQDPHALGGCTGNPCKGQIYMFDGLARGWDTIEISHAPADYPRARGGHTMTAVRSTALVCGGYQPPKQVFTDFEKSKGIFTRVKLQAAGGAIDCWWLEILPTPRWFRLETSGTDQPVHRADHTAVYDKTSNNVIIFGGETLNTTLLADCWYLSASATPFSWNRCDAEGIGPRPDPRRGHSAVFYNGDMYILGGYAQSIELGGLSSEHTVRDTWKLENYANSADRPARNWLEITPLSETPPSRAFHSAWILGGEDGFKMVIHGGTSSEGSGENSALADTWRFDLSTSVWVSYGSDPAAPAVSHSMVLPLNNASSVLFGGRTAANKLLGKLMFFDATRGWSAVLPAGVRPERRLGHTVSFDDQAYSMLVTHGMSWNGKLLNDTWLFNTQSLKWQCLFGTSTACPPMSNHRTAPAASAFAAYVTIGVHLFTFGGVAGNAATPTRDIWTFHTSAHKWSQVLASQVAGSQTILGTTYTWDAAVAPPARSHATVVPLGRYAGMFEPVVMIGGKVGTLSSEPQPSDAVWMIDLQEKEAESGDDYMAVFDGQDDVVTVPLPQFAHTSRGLSAVWIEAWAEITAGFGYTNMVIFEALGADAIILRLVFTTIDDKPFARLYQFPDTNQETIIKTWGPIDAPGWGSSWHHWALTLRFAHVVGTGVEPNAVLAQAFFFVDGDAIPDDGAFFLLDLRALSFASGFDRFQFGASEASGDASLLLRTFQGYMDNIRIWWIQCPPGPTKCNPYGFLYPQQTYAPFQRVPDAGILDSQVQLKDVAPVIMESMFKHVWPEDTPGLLAAIEMNGQQLPGLLVDSSTWLPACENQSTHACPECPQECVFDRCAEFDVDCISSSLGLSKLHFLAEEGKCECQDSLTCPTAERSCKCPSGFTRECAEDGYTAETCPSWSCECNNRFKATCTECRENGKKRTPPDPCSEPAKCQTRVCKFPFLSIYDTNTTDSESKGPPSKLDGGELMSFANDTVFNMLSPNQASFEAVRARVAVAYAKHDANGGEGVYSECPVPPWEEGAGKGVCRYNMYNFTLMKALKCHADVDQDGYVSAEEVWTRLLGDQNADDIVDFDEFLAAYANGSVIKLVESDYEEGKPTSTFKNRIWNPAEYQPWLDRSCQPMVNLDEGVDCSQCSITEWGEYDWGFCRWCSAFRNDADWETQFGNIPYSAIYIQFLNGSQSASGIVGDKITFSAAGGLFDLELVTDMFKNFDYDLDNMISVYELDCYAREKFLSEYDQEGLCQQSLDDKSNWPDYCVWVAEWNKCPESFFHEPEADTGYYGYYGNSDYLYGDPYADPFVDPYGSGFDFGSGTEERRVLPYGQQLSMRYWSEAKHSHNRRVSLMSSKRTSAKAKHKSLSSVPSPPSVRSARPPYSANTVQKNGILFAAASTGARGLLTVGAACAFDSDCGCAEWCNTTVLDDNFEGVCEANYTCTDNGGNVDCSCAAADTSSTSSSGSASDTTSSSGSASDTISSSGTSGSASSSPNDGSASSSPGDGSMSSSGSSDAMSSSGSAGDGSTSGSASISPDGGSASSSPADGSMSSSGSSDAGDQLAHSSAGDGSASGSGEDSSAASETDAASASGSLGGGSPSDNAEEGSASASSPSSSCACPTGQVCDGLGGCLDCTGDEHCSGQYCDTDSNTCVACTSDDHCSGQYCNTVSNTCADCTSDDHCSGQYCDTDQNSCADCTSNDHCSSDQFCADDGTCVGCDSCSTDCNSCSNPGFNNCASRCTFSDTPTTGSGTGSGSDSSVCYDNSACSSGQFCDGDTGECLSCDSCNPCYIGSPCATGDWGLGNCNEICPFLNSQFESRVTLDGDWTLATFQSTGIAAFKESIVQAFSYSYGILVNTNSIVVTEYCFDGQCTAVSSRRWEGAHPSLLAIPHGRRKLLVAGALDITYTVSGVPSSTAEQATWDSYFNENLVSAVSERSSALGVTGSVTASLEALTMLEQSFDTSGLYFGSNCVDPPTEAGSCLGKTLRANNNNNAFMLGRCPCQEQDCWPMLAYDSQAYYYAQYGAITEDRSAKRAVFRLFDSNEDDSLSRAELQGAEGYGADLEGDFEEIDKDSDNSITQDELYSFLLEGAHGSTDWFVAIFDADCNGHIQEKEASWFCMNDFFFQIADFYQIVEGPDSDPPVEMYCLDAPFVEPWETSFRFLHPEDLAPYLQSMHFIRQQDNNTYPQLDGLARPATSQSSTTEWLVTTSQTATSNGLAGLIQAVSDSTSGVRGAGPQFIASLILGAPDEPEGWGGLLIEVMDTDGDNKLTWGEAESIYWLKEQYFDYLDKETVNSTFDGKLDSAELGNLKQHMDAYFLISFFWGNNDIDKNWLMSKEEWEAATGSDPQAPSFATVDTDGDNAISVTESLKALSSASFGTYPRCNIEDNPCSDCVTWDAGFGDCSTYSCSASDADTNNCQYCNEDADQYGILARDACPSSCAAKGSTLLCGPNREAASYNLTFTAKGVEVFRTEIPALALPSGTAVASVRSKFPRSSGSSGDALSLAQSWSTDPVWTASNSGLAAPEIPTRHGVISRKNGGIDNTVVNHVVKGSTTMAAPVTVTMAVDPCAAKEASGCTLAAANTLKLCAPGSLDVNVYDETTMVWRLPVRATENTSSINSTASSGNETACTCDAFTAGTCNNVEQLSVRTKELSRWWMIITKPACCIYNDTAKSCNMKVCDYSGEGRRSPGFRGQGSVVKMPRLRQSNKPKFADSLTFQQKKTQLDLKNNETEATYVPSTGWLQLCPDGLVHALACPADGTPKQHGQTWFSHRYGHAAVAISSSRIIIYGGFGCNQANRASDGTCLVLESFNDAWELYVKSIGSGTSALALKGLTSTSMTSRFKSGGLMALPVADQTNVIYVIGGSRFDLSKSIYMSTSRPKTNESFVSHELLLRDQKSSTLRSLALPAISFASAAGNESAAISFGGVVANSVTSGVFAYNLLAATGDSAFQELIVEGTSPSPRAFGHALLLDSERMMLYGGIHSATNDSGIGVRRDALGDVWYYTFITSSWEQQTISAGIRDSSVHSFDASSQFTLSENVLLLVHGGVSDSYKPGLTSSARWNSQTRTPFPYGPGKKQASSEFRALLPDSFVDGTSLNKWVRIRAADQKRQCVSAAPLCNDIGGDDYWRCMSAPYPWWAAVSVTVSPCTWAPPSDSCKKKSDSATQACTVALPPAMTCEPPPRYMHTLTAAPFNGGKATAFVYGGLDIYGQRLSDIWMYDLGAFPTDPTCRGCAWLTNLTIYARLDKITCDSDYWEDFKLILADLFDDTADNVHFDVIQSSTNVLDATTVFCNYTCGSESEEWEYNSVVNEKAKASRFSLQVSVVNWRGYYNFLHTKCVAAGGCKEAFQQAGSRLAASRPAGNVALSGASVLNFQPLLAATSTSTLQSCYDALSNQDDPEEFKRSCLTFREIRAPVVKLDDSLSCTDQCARGICQVANDTSTASNSIQCNAPGPCGEGGVCSLPGPRSGHASTSFRYKGGLSALIIFGGETFSYDENGQRASVVLTNDVTTGIMESGNLLLAKMNIACNTPSSCPVGRRDASITMIDQKGGSSGKLVVFGGVTGLSTTAQISNFLDNDMTTLVSLDDTWVLNLDQIHATGTGDVCLYYGRCVVALKWQELEVPGEKPMSRFGAVLAAQDRDGEGILFLANGVRESTSIASSISSTELDDLYTFQLRDPFFRRCSATGRGLITAVAGQRTSFTIACVDIIGQPASGAQFTILITGDASCSNCPKTSPPVLTVGNGLYRVDFTPVTAGEYILTIDVGRGGPQFQDPVGGDPSAESSLDLQTILNQVAVNNGEAGFNLVVEPGPTSNPDTVAMGNSLTLTTAGTASQFLIRALDSFDNRRPGGEDISVIMTFKAAVGVFTAAKVVDNNDGEYSIQYTILRAGEYELSITVNGLLGANSPFTLQVNAEIADISKTYAYGQFLEAATGAENQVFVQTRDVFGNKITADPETYPDGQDLIEFEACAQTGSGCPDTALDSNCVCLDGKKDQSVNVQRFYGEGPRGTRDASNNKYLGLYKFTYVPLSASSLTPLVRHNKEYITCYFEILGTIQDAEDPQQKADDCANAEALRKAQESARRNFELVEGSVRSKPSAGASNLLDRDASKGTEATGVVGFSRRQSVVGADGSAFNPATDNVSMSIAQTFIPPDNSTAERWTILAPILCAAVGAAFAVIEALVQYYIHHRKSKRAMIAEAAKFDRASSEGSHENEPERATARQLGIGSREEAELKQPVASQTRALPLNLEQDLEPEAEVLPTAEQRRRTSKLSNRTHEEVSLEADLATVGKAGSVSGDVPRPIEAYGRGLTPTIPEPSIFASTPEPQPVFPERAVQPPAEQIHLPTFPAFFADPSVDIPALQPQALAAMRSREGSPRGRSREGSIAPPAEDRPSVENAPAASAPQAPQRESKQEDKRAKPWIWSV